MARPQVSLEELVVHRFYPLDEDLAGESYRNVLALWQAWQSLLGYPIAGTDIRVDAPARFADTGSVRDEETVIAGQESFAGDRQALLRRRNNVLNVSVAFACHRYDESRSARTLLSPEPAWTGFHRQWEEMTSPADDLMLGEARLHLATAAELPTDDGPLLAAAGEAARPRLPAGPERHSWWTRGTVISTGIAVWEVSPPTAEDLVRRIVVLAPPSHDYALSAWTWSDTRPVIPPFARYLLHAARLRREERRWRQEENTAAELRARTVSSLDRLRFANLITRTELAEARQVELELAVVRAALVERKQVVEMAADNMARNLAATVPAPRVGTLFGDDFDRSRWLGKQLDDEIAYLDTDAGLLRTAREVIRDTNLPDGPEKERPTQPLRRVHVAEPSEEPDSADGLDGLFGRKAAGALRDWAAGKGGTVRTPVRGWQWRGPHTGAVLGHVVLELLGRGGRTSARKLIVKICPGETAYENEAGRTQRAWTRSPEFASAHLVSQPDTRYPVGDGRFLMFQELVGNPVDTRTIADIPAEQFATAASAATRLVLGRWNNVANPHILRTTVGEYLTMELRGELEEDRPAWSWAKKSGALDAKADLITVGDGPAAPNPVTMATKESAASRLPMEYLAGFSHGDLHLANVMVPRQSSGPAQMKFIDLSAYEEDAPLSRDVATLLLSIVESKVRQELNPPAAAELLDFVVGASDARQLFVENAVIEPVRAVHQTVDELVTDEWKPEWQTQFLLSLQAQALVHLSYENVGPAGHWWFFQLATRAAQEFNEVHNAGLSGSTGQVRRIEPPDSRSHPDRS